MSHFEDSSRFFLFLSSSRTQEDMSAKAANGRVTVEQTPVVIPDLTIKDLLSAIPYVDSIFCLFGGTVCSQTATRLGSTASSARP